MRARPVLDAVRSRCMLPKTLQFWGGLSSAELPDLPTGMGKVSHPRTLAHHRADRL